MSSRLKNKDCPYHRRRQRYWTCHRLGLATEGARIGLIGRGKALLDTAAHEIGNASMVFEADVSKQSDSGAAFSAKGRAAVPSLTSLHCLASTAIGLGFSPTIGKGEER
jgi:hypothetical protein